MSAQDDIEPPTITELGDFFSASVETLIVCGLARHVDTQTWARILTAFPHLKYLEIIGQCCGKLPPAFEPTPAGTFCAHLREFVLRYKLYERDDLNGIRDTLEELRAMLQKRTEAEGGLRLESLIILLEHAQEASPMLVAYQLHYEAWKQW